MKTIYAIWYTVFLDCVAIANELEIAAYACTFALCPLAIFYMSEKIMNEE